MFLKKTLTLFLASLFATLGFAQMADQSEANTEKDFKFRAIAELGFLYSVFDGPAGNATWLIFLGEIERYQAAPDLECFAVEDLPLQEVEPRQIRSVLTRYQTEFRKARFGLYVDDAEHGGQISPIERSAKSWTKFITEQESPL